MDRKLPLPTDLPSAAERRRGSRAGRAAGDRKPVEAGALVAGHAA